LFSRNGSFGMGRITSSVGLVTGTNINDTVDQLISIAARPRDLVVNANKTIDSQRTALTQLTAQLIATQLTIKKFSNTSLYNQRVVSSSDSTLLTATANGTPSLGNYQFTPLRLATSQQLQSSKFTSNTTPIGAGTLKYRFGGFIDAGVGLDTLNDGAGFTAGKIRVTDRSGASTEIDLSTARNVDDVLKAINSNTAIKVKATTVNGAIRLTDLSGGSAANLRVQEINNGSTAASLGLAGINAAATSATGTEIGRLFGDLGLAQLNDGAGVRLDSSLPDFRVTFRDGTSATIDLKKLGTAGNKAAATTTAANGVDAQLTFTAKTAGPDLGGVTISFVDDPSVTAGAEVATYDSNTKTLTFRIDEGVTTGDQIIAALSRDTTASAAFTVARALDSNGSGLITSTDTGVTAGPKATITTAGVDSPNAKLKFEAVQGGGAFDDVQIEFIDDPLIVGGNETVVFDDSDPNNKKLTFRIDQGNTTADDIVRTLTDDPTASQYFKVANVAGSTGRGKVIAEDSTYTVGGALKAAISATNETTLQHVVAVLNNAAPGKLSATIVNNRLELKDLSTDNGGDFTIEDLFGSHAGEDLGLATTPVGDTITGSRIYSGLKTALLSSLNGSKGLGALGDLQLTDRSGATATVDLSAAETLDDVIEGINNAGLGLRAGYNASRTGLQLTDTTGLTASNLIAANADGTNTADKLGLTASVAANSKLGTDLKLQIVSEATLLSSLNGGAGVARGTINITDNAGLKKTLTIDDSLKTVGDLITKIDSLGLAIDARINEAGDGIVLVDTTDGSGAGLAVTEGNSTVARDLHLLNTATTATIDNVSRKVIDGSQTYTVTLTATDTLADLTSKINALNGRVRANVINDGGGVKPYGFTLFNQVTGSASSLLIDTSGVNFSLNETVAAQDALLQIGGSGGTLISSTGNTFNNVLPDVNLTINGTSTSAVTVNVTKSTSNLVGVVKDFVTAYNKVRSSITTLTSYNTDTNTGAILQGDGTVLRAETDLARFVTGRLFGAGSIQTIASLGVSIDDQGLLSLDESKLQSVLDERPDEVKQFITSTDTGFTDKFNKLVEQLAGVGNSLLVSRAGALTRKYDTNTERIEKYNARLDRQRERLLASYARIETVIAKLQANQTYLNTLSSVASSYSSN
jgi:flagellar capping protein FliD